LPAIRELQNEREKESTHGQGYDPIEPAVKMQVRLKYVHKKSPLPQGFPSASGLKSEAVQSAEEGREVDKAKRGSSRQWATDTASAQKQPQD
jgi:hypothetical protein